MELLHLLVNTLGQDLRRQEQEIGWLEKVLMPLADVQNELHQGSCERADVAVLSFENLDIDIIVLCTSIDSLKMVHMVISHRGDTCGD